MTLHEQLQKARREREDFLKNHPTYFMDKHNWTKYVNSLNVYDEKEKSWSCSFTYKHNDQPVYMTDLMFFP